MKSIISGIYRATHKESGKVYIGQSLNIYERWDTYKRISSNPNNYKNDRRHFTNAIRKYGFDAFTWEILKETYDLDYWEIFFIKIHRATEKEFGYNAQPGGQFRMFNTEIGEQVKDKIRDSVRTSQKVKDGLYNYYITKGGLKGHFTEEQYNEYIKKQKESHLGKKWSKESIIKRSATVSKKVKCLNDGKIFNSTKECDYYYRKRLGVNRIHVVEVCQEKRLHCHGLKFIYV